LTQQLRTVALNALFLAPGESGGPETYLRGLAGALAAEFPHVRLVVVTTGSGKRALQEHGLGDGVDLRALPAEEHNRARRQFSEQVLLPLTARAVGADVIHSLASTGPGWTPGLTSVVTLHDVTFLRLRTFGRVTTWGMRRVVSWAARDADALISGSAAARDEICSELRLKPSSFTVVPHGIDPAASASPAAAEEVRTMLGVGNRRLVLCVAAVRPHKNQELLVRAATALPDDVTVVMVGHQEPYAEAVRRLVGELGVEQRVHLAGYLPADKLEGLWATAHCAAFPSLAEGFGLPVVEAMSRGVPVACSDIPVLREVGGGVPLFFNPRDPAAAAAAVTAALDDPSIGARGLKRAGQFSWIKAAHATMEVYERALAATRP